MIIQRINFSVTQNNPFFEGRHYKSELKSLFKEGRLPSVKKGIYGGWLNAENASLEHLKPHHFGGSNNLRNYALATRVNNNKRGLKDILSFTTIETIKQYLNQFKNISVPFNEGKQTFDGNNYIKGLKATLKKLGINIPN